MNITSLAAGRRLAGPYLLLPLLCLAALLSTPSALSAQDPNEPGILEPVTSKLQNKEIRVPNTDQSVDGVEQTNIEGTVVYEDALTTTSLLGHPITHVASPNEDMRLALQSMANAAAAGDPPAMQAAAVELQSILLGTTEGRIYDGFSMLNFNRFKNSAIGPEHFPSDVVPGEYKMKVAQDTGQTYTSPFDGEQRKIWEVDINMLYYDGQIDADTFLLKFPFGHHEDDVLHVNYRIYSLVNEDFSPTLVMLDRREALNTVQFPFKGFDAVWIDMQPGQVLNVTVKYPPIRMIRGVYDWGWRQHPPRIQFLQPIYEIQNFHTGDIELDPQGESFAFRNREELTLHSIGGAAPEMKMFRVAREVLRGTPAATIEAWLTDVDSGPLGTWIEWADLALVQSQLPREAWSILEQEDGLAQGQYGDYHMISVYMNNEMYGEGPFINEVMTWLQGDVFRVKLINLDNHTHYFRNVDFSARLHDDMQRCCGGGETSFEIMNFGPSYGAPKVAEMQWRAGWGFRPHYDVIQQSEVFPRGRDRAGLKPYSSGLGDWYYGYQYSDDARGGDFRFNPPPFVITDHDNPAPYPLTEHDGEVGLLIGQFTEGYGVGQVCPGDPYPGFCETDLGPLNPFGALNWPDPADPNVPKTELRFPPFLRNPAQGQAGAGDIIPPTGAWRVFLWINPNNGSLYIDPDDPSQGHWADLTFSHGTPVFARKTLEATIEGPRSSGQLFYQFDDLFHDNSIFSPHPLPSPGGKEVDAVEQVKAKSSGTLLSVRGQVSEFSVTGTYTGWVSVHDGPAGSHDCDGEIIGVAPVNKNGRFRFEDPSSNIGAGAPVCVQSIIGGYAGATVQ